MNKKRLFSFIVFSCLITMAMGMLGAVALPATALADGNGPDPSVTSPSTPDPDIEATIVEPKGEDVKRSLRQNFSVITVIEIVMRTAII